MNCKLDIILKIITGIMLSISFILTFIGKLDLFQALILSVYILLPIFTYFYLIYLSSNKKAIKIKAKTNNKNL